MLLMVIYIHLRTNQTIFFCDTPQKMECESCKKGKFLKRKPNWNLKDTQTLVTLAVENSEDLFSKFSTSVTSENKKTVWAETTKQ